MHHHGIAGTFFVLGVLAFLFYVACASAVDKGGGPGAAGGGAAGGSKP